MNDLDRRLCAYAQGIEAPPPVSEGTLRARLAQRRAKRTESWQLGLSCLLAGLLALSGLWALGLAAALFPSFALASLAMGLGLWGGLLAGGAVLWQARLDRQQ